MVPAHLHQMYNVSLLVLEAHTVNVSRSSGADDVSDLGPEVVELDLRVEAEDHHRWSWSPSHHGSWARGREREAR